MLRTRQLPLSAAFPTGLANFQLSIVMSKDISEPSGRLNLNFKRIFKRGKSSWSWQMEMNTQTTFFSQLRQGCSDFFTSEVLLTFHLDFVEYNFDKLALPSDWNSNWQSKSSLLLRFSHCFNSESVRKSY